MQQKGNFLLMSREEFRPWLQKQKITRPISRLQVHHTYMPDYSTTAKNSEFTILENMRNFHVKTNGWRATGQNITVFPNGMIAISLDRNLNDVPAGIRGANTGAICVENIGNFNAGGDVITAEHRKTIIHLYACMAEKFNIPIDTDHIVYHAWYTATGTRLPDYDPKRSSKTCPGDKWWGDGNTIAAAKKNFLPQIKAELNRLKGVPTTTPVTPNPIIKEEDQPMTEAEKKMVDEMKKVIEQQATVIADQGKVLDAIVSRLNLYGKETYVDLYKDAVWNAKQAGAITSSADKSKIELNIIQMMDNMGLFKKS